MVALGTMVSIAWLSASSATAASKSVVRIGLVAPTDAPILSNPDAFGAAQAFVEALNKNGGLHGHHVDLVYCDDKGDPNIAAQCGQQMVSSHVIAVIGGGVLGSASLNPILAQAGIARIGAIAFTTSDYTSPNVFLFAADPIGQDVAAAYMSKTLRIRNIAIVASDNATANSWVPGIASAIQKTGGNVTSTVSVPAGVADWSPVAASAESGSPAGVVGILQTSQAVPLMQSLQSEGFSWAYWQLASITTAGLQQMGPALSSRVLQYQAYPPFNSKLPAVKDMIQQLQTAYNHGDSNANPTTVTAVQSYSEFLAIKALQDITAGMSDISAKTVFAALKKAKNLNLGGIIPPWTPEKPGPAGYPRLSNDADYMIGYNGTVPYLRVKKPITLAQAESGKN
jgi:ABC-type branched-subunit amino acid transport system substrate-binding protein